MGVKSHESQVLPFYAYIYIYRERYIDIVLVTTSLAAAFFTLDTHDFKDYEWVNRYILLSQHQTNGIDIRFLSYWTGPLTKPCP